ncbi:MAG: DUF4169 family protein [Salaquimonas sp.]|jgi:hypothetical protein|nr:DUF4169 family protein [Salaquimonas sp.]
MAEIINLRQARKRAARAGKERKAEENRALHSLPGAKRKAAARNNDKDRQRHEAHLREQDGREKDPD